MKKVLLFISLLFSLHSLWAQTTYKVSGVIKDSTGQQMIGANILLIAGKDTLHTASNEAGIFNFPKVKQTIFTLRITVMGYNPWYREFSYKEAGEAIDLPSITMTMRTNNLNEVIIKGKASAMIMKEDTIEYRADGYKLRPNSVVEDLLKRLPGMEVDQDGNITSLGKKITKIRINGKDFMVNDIKTLTRLLPVDLIDKLQLIDDYGDMARATGRKTGEPQHILNIQTKSDLSKVYQGKAIAGAGNDGRHNLGVMTNYFSEQQQFSLIGNSNNTSSQTGKVTNSAGNVNYRNNISKAFTINTGFGIGHSKSSQLSSSTVQTVTSEGTLFSANSNNSSNSSDNYSFNGGAEYRPDVNTMGNLNLSINSGSSIGNNILSANQTGFQHKDQLTSNYVTSSSPNIGASIFATHRFKGLGRVVSLNFSVNNSDNKSNQDSYDSLRYYKTDNTVLKDSLLHQLLYKTNNNLNTNSQFSYIEPLDSTSSLELKYVINTTQTSNKLETEWINPAGKKTFMDSLSNQYAYTMIQQQIELNYRRNKGKLDYTLGARLQPSLLRSSIISGQRAIKRSTPLVPVFTAQYKLPHRGFFMLTYMGNVGFPSYQQLLPVTDLTNAQFPVIGNPDLRTSFTHSSALSYRSGGQNALFLSLSGSYIKDNIVSNVVLVKDSFNTVKQETRFLNADGAYNVGLNYGWSRRFNDGKYNIHLNGNGSYNNNILFLDNVQKAAQNLTLSQSIRGSMLLQWLELTGNIRYSYNRNVYAQTESSVTNLTTWAFNMNGKIYFLKSFSLYTEVRKQLNSGYRGGTGTDPMMVNSTLEKTFFKRKLTCRLQGYNLLDEGISLSQSVSGNTVTESRNQLAGRYFILSLQCDLKLFKSR
ncbi:Outer membrane receptor proteins, mostly Fe transport [Chitinophaga sp. CF118]|uniref:outer membrane beta-barrel protein n=1 Tax=Chitinophaga sp. CF118 TaxID=1884367 RepID=UPI0008E791AB|nr:outer membrane beta-barrel protein [Chitinophaga sp. CF118]SFD21135.1 Outer membrane receptor proteins, mostly Fe transport [Chitinophaga sp. CF118]